MFLLLNPIKTLVLAALAFFAGVAFEKVQAQDRCLEAGGTVLAGVCKGVVK